MVYPGDEEQKKVPVVDTKPDSFIGNQLQEKPPNDDTVTLTKSQLRAILEAIGQVNSVNINDQPQKQLGNEQSDKDSSNDSSCCGKKDSEANGSSIPESNCQSTCPLDNLLPESSEHWSSVPEKSQNPSSTKLSGLSKLEQKRVQWEKEKAEMHDWNPWGKPGAGAPTRRALPVASVAPRTENQLLMVHTSAVPYSNSSVPNGISSCLTSPSHFRGGITAAEQCGQDLHFNKTFTSYNCITQPVKPVPPVFKSSINFGSIDDESISGESDKKQQWLKDLECQREEQRLRRMPESERFNQIQDSEWVNGNMEDIDSVSVSVDGSAALCQTDGRSYVRGQGFRLDPVSAARAEKRRQKAQEYQQAIRLQMEEKQQRLQEEKEKKKREEEEEERRLIAERARLQAEYEQEQYRLKQKKEMEEQKQTAVISAVRKAEAEAEAERKSRKSHKLQPVSCDNEILNNSVNSSSPKKSSNESFSPRSQTKILEQKKEINEASRTSQQTATVRPLQNSNVDSHQNLAKNEKSPKKELGIQTVPLSAVDLEEYSGYTVNRILTPSPYRIKSRRGRAKDFGTQTDINYGRWIGDDAESTDQSNTSSICSPMVKRLNRVQHSKPYKASRHPFGNEMDSLTDRPKWGANQPSKSFIRMTDRDPHFTKRKKMQELRKQHWEREMANQQALRNARRSTVTSYPTLRSRRTRSSSDGTVGFSSSEFETSHIRSNSPPQRRRNYGFRSVCGSAEDVAYLGHSSTYSSTLLPSVHRRRASQSSDNLPSIIGGSEPAPSTFTERFSFPEVSSCSGTTVPIRRKWRSQEAFYPHAIGHERTHSPPVPALQRSLLAEQKSNSLPSPATHSRRKWSDQESFDLESVALSHAQSHHSTSEDGSDRNDRESLSSADSLKPKAQTGHNPLVCPEVVTRRPTPRQDRILQNLSSLRQGLLQKQKELETLIRNPPHVS